MGMDEKRDHARKAFEVARQRKQPELLKAKGVEPGRESPHPEPAPKGPLHGQGKSEGLKGRQQERARTFRETLEAKVNEGKTRPRGGHTMRDAFNNNADRNIDRSR